MRALSPCYTLEIEGNRIRLYCRTTGQLTCALDFTQTANILRLMKPPPPLDAQAQRLILQSALAHQGVARIEFPLSTEILPPWAQMGARIVNNNIEISQSDFEAANQALGCKGAAWLERDLPSQHVACLVLIDAQNRVLLTQRPAGKPFANLWEFPGGKIEMGESAELALCREIREELGLTIWNSCLSPLTFASHTYAGFHLTLLAYVCYRFDGEPKGREGQGLKWWPYQALDPGLMPPANAPLVYAIQDLLS